MLKLFFESYLKRFTAFREFLFWRYGVMIWVKKRPKITCFWVILSFSREKITHEKDEAQTNIHVKENGITVNSTSQSPQERHGTLETRAGGLNSVRGINQPLFSRKVTECRMQNAESSERVIFKNGTFCSSSDQTRRILQKICEKSQLSKKLVFSHIL